MMVSETLDTYRRFTYKLMCGLRHTVDNYKFTFLVVNSEDTVVNVAGSDKYLTDLIARGRDRLYSAINPSFVK